MKIFNNNSQEIGILANRRPVKKQYTCLDKNLTTRSAMQINHLIHCIALLLAAFSCSLFAMESKQNHLQMVFRPDYRSISVDINHVQKQQIADFIKHLKSSQINRIRLVGHSDSIPISHANRSVIADNYQLAKLRAQSLAELLAQEINNSELSIEVTSVGAQQPIASNLSKQGRERNKRIVVDFFSQDPIDLKQLSQDYAPLITAGNNKKNHRLNHQVVNQIFKNNLVSLTLTDTPITEAMAMLSKQNRVNILVSKEIIGNVSLNLYDVSVDSAVKAIAKAAGYITEYHNGIYYIVNPTSSGKFNRGITKIKTYKVLYSDSRAIETILKNHLSNFGKVTALADRNIVVVEDTPEFLENIDLIMRAIDKKPIQILIEAQILEITLDDSESYGLDWKKIFKSDGGNGSFGTRSLATPNAGGLFLELATPNIDIALNLLSTEGRVKTLSTPKLMVLENQESEVVIGDRIGYKLTTTINQVTTESIAFLESGVILKVKPKVDEYGKILLEIHPEVSNGTVTAGIPSQSTTEVTTQVLVDNSQTVFIGGLIKRNQTDSREKVTGLGSIPVLGALFRSESKTSLNTETVVMITPHIIVEQPTENELNLKQRIKKHNQWLRQRALDIDGRFSHPEAPAASFLNTWGGLDETVW
jgi:type II secretory pathway component GspD/PulD (secretin)